VDQGQIGHGPDLLHGWETTLCLGVEALVDRPGLTGGLDHRPDGFATVYRSSGRVDQPRGVSDGHARHGHVPHLENVRGLGVGPECVRVA